MKLENNSEPKWFYKPDSRTRDGYLTVLIDSATSITLSQLSGILGLPVDSIVRYSIDLGFERFASASIDEVQQVLKRSSLHHVPEGGFDFGWVYRESEIKATLPREMLPQFRERTDTESWGERQDKFYDEMNNLGF